MPKTYEAAEAVEAIAKRLLPMYHAELATARILFYYVDKASMKDGKAVLGKVRKVTGALEWALEQDFMVEVALDTYNDLSEDQREALVDHLLERCTGEEDEKDASMKWKTRQPDVQEFTTILRRHGAWTEDLRGLISVAQRINISERVQDIVDTETTQGVAAQI